MLRYTFQRFLRHLAAPSRRHHRRRSSQSILPVAAQILEERVVLSSVSLSPDGILNVAGDAAENEILVSQDDRSVHVSVDGEVFSFSNSQVTGLEINGLAGNDRLINNTDLNATLNGGSDLTLGEGGDDDITGDDGADFLFGGLGSNTIRRDAFDVVFANFNDLVL